MKNVIIAFPQIQFFPFCDSLSSGRASKAGVWGKPDLSHDFHWFWHTVFHWFIQFNNLIIKCHFNFTMFFKIDTLLDYVGWAFDFHSFLQVAQSTGTCQHPWLKAIGVTMSFPILNTNISISCSPGTCQDRLELFASHFTALVTNLRNDGRLPSVPRRVLKFRRSEAVAEVTQQLSVLGWSSDPDTWLACPVPPPHQQMAVVLQYAICWFLAKLMVLTCHCHLFFSRSTERRSGSPPMPSPNHVSAQPSPGDYQPIVLTSSRLSLKNVALIFFLLLPASLGE